MRKDQRSGYQSLPKFRKGNRPIGIAKFNPEGMCIEGIQIDTTYDVLTGVKFTYNLNNK
jgi:hypothetical protein